MDYDHFYRQVMLDSRTGQIAVDDTPLEFLVKKVVLDLPRQAHSWAQREGLTLYSDLLVDSIMVSEKQLEYSGELVQQPILHMAAPAQFSVYRLTDSVQSQSQRIRLEAVVSKEARFVSLWVDGEMLAKLFEQPYQAWWILEEGSHEFYAEAQLLDGEMIRSETVSIQVEPIPTSN